MANRRNKEKKAREIIVEADFLFGLRKTDSRHPKVVHALHLHKKGQWSIKILSSAVIEVRNVLYSRGFAPKVVGEIVAIMNEILNSFDVEEFIPLELDDLIVGAKLQDENPRLTFYDSLHASALKRLGSTILTSEGFYELLGIDVLDLDKLVVTR